MLRPTFMSLVLVFCAFASAGADANRVTAAPAPSASNLPLVQLEAKEQIVSERKVPCIFRTTYPPGMPGGASGAFSGVVRIHGASSQGYPKKSFGLTLEQPNRWPGMRESTHWVLNAAFVDRSLMRHKLSYDLFRAMSTAGGKRFAAASRFVEVNLNGGYQGVFLLMERVDRTLLELQPFNSNAPSHACIYKAVDHGGDFGQPGHGAFEQREPDPLVLSYWDPLDEFSRFVSRARPEELFDPKTGIASRLDLDNTIDFHLLVLLTANLDGTDKNLIVARDAATASTPAPRFFFAPWDYDATFGRNWNATPVEPTVWLSNFIWDTLLGDVRYGRKFAERWRVLRATAFSERSILAMIDDNVRALGDAAKRNAMRWRSADVYYPDQLAFDGDIAEMRTWVSARLKWLDETIGRRFGRDR